MYLLKDTKWRAMHAHVDRNLPRLRITSLVDLSSFLFLSASQFFSNNLVFGL